jgi:hypothetical protein
MILILSQSVCTHRETGIFDAICKIFWGRVAGAGEILLPQDRLQKILQRARK